MISMMKAMETMNEKEKLEVKLQEKKRDFIYLGQVINKMSDRLEQIRKDIEKLEKEIEENEYT